MKFRLSVDLNIHLCNQAADVQSEVSSPIFVNMVDTSIVCYTSIRGDKFLHVIAEEKSLEFVFSTETVHENKNEELLRFNHLNAHGPQDTKLSK